MDKQFGLLGETLKHSHSPEIHGLMGDPNYKIFEVEKSKLRDFIKAREFDGLNVTIPYKRAVMPLLSNCSETARKTGSVNTIVKKDDGKLYGYNTDVFGFAYLIEFSKISIRDKFCLVLGDGGGAAAVKLVLDAMGASRIVCLTRSGQNKLSDIANFSDAQILINTTPVGMYPNNGEAAVSLDGLNRLEAVFDIVYNPLKTQILLDAESRGIPAFNGLPMLTAQAKRSRELFLDAAIDDDVIPKLTARIAGQMLNITLIGMPGCGKTTIGKALAERLNRRVIDLDEAIVKLYGKTPAEIIKTNGEAEFRRTEHVTAQWAGKRTGIIISTGGGVVTRPDNRAPLAQNGVIVFIHRDIKQLPLDERPISQSMPIEELYEKRLPLYRSWADFEIENNGSIDDAVDAILNCLSK